MGKEVIINGHTWWYNTEDDIERYLYNGWECKVFFRGNGWDYEAFPEGNPNCDFDDTLVSVNSPFETKQMALDEFIAYAQERPEEWADPDYEGELSDYNLTAVIIKKKAKKKKKVRRDQRGSLHRAWSLLVRNRDGNKCVRCGSTAKLEAHHVKSYKDFPELRYDIDNGETLCNICHRKHHKKNGR